MFLFAEYISVEQCTARALTAIENFLNVERLGHHRDQITKFYVDGGEIGGMSRCINHSCDPNLYVQPVLCDHGDTDMPKICLFAAKNIPPFEELTYDYGQQYIRENLDDKCNCGAACCQNPAD